MHRHLKAFIKVGFPEPSSVAGQDSLAAGQHRVLEMLQYSLNTAGNRQIAAELDIPMSLLDSFPCFSSFDK